MTACSISECDRKASARGWCSMHYSRWQKHGDPALRVRVYRRRDERCAVDICDKPSSSRGWCHTHYTRWLKTGDPMGLKRRPDGTGTIDSGGYVRLSLADGVHRHEHRVVMEGVIGRALLPGENVHHRNGDRADNRPENLELWSRTQPPGQRIEDKVLWAREILQQYDTEEWIGGGC